MTSIVKCYLKNGLWTEANIFKSKDEEWAVFHFSSVSPVDGTYLTAQIKLPVILAADHGTIRQEAAEHAETTLKKLPGYFTDEMSEAQESLIREALTKHYQKQIKKVLNERKKQ